MLKNLIRSTLLTRLNFYVGSLKSLTPTIKHFAALLRKLERENYRTLHCRVATRRADHFLNFCITAHSMRDHLLEHVKATGTSNPNLLYER